MSAEDVEFEIKAHDRSGPAMRGAADGLDKVGDKAERAARKVDDLGDETGQLARKLLEARAAAVGLAKEFDRSGDPKILKDFEKINREAGRLGRVMKSIKFDEPKIENPDGFLGGVVKSARKAGLIAGDAMVEGIGDAFKALPPDVQAGILAAGIGLVTAFEGAILAGVSAGGIATGLILGAQDDRVKAAYAQLGSHIMTDLKQDARGFTDELLRLAPQFESEFGRLDPLIKRIFDNLSKDAGPVLGNIVTSIEAIAPALERASVAGGYVLTNFTSKLPVLTGAIGDLLDSFSSQASGSAVELNLLIYTVSGLIEAFRLANDTLNPFLTGLGKLGELTGVTSDQTHHLVDWHAKLGAQTGITAEQYASFAYDLGNTAAMAGYLDAAFHRLFDTQMSVDQANLAVNVGMSQLKQTIKDNKKTLDEHTQAGQQNVQAILSQIQVLEQKREADIAAGNGTVEATEKADAAYASNVQALRAVLIQLGLAPAAVDALIAKYEQIPKNITTTVTTVFQTRGVRPGGSDELTGHSRDTVGTSADGGLSSWAPAAYAESQRAEMSADNAGGRYSGPPTEVHAEHTFNVLLDGEPFRAIAISTVNAAQERSAWRAKIGRR